MVVMYTYDSHYQRVIACQNLVPMGLMVDHIVPYIYIYIPISDFCCPMAPIGPQNPQAPAEVSKAKSESLLQHFLVSSVHPGAGNCQWVSHIVTVKTRGVINQGLALYIYIIYNI